MGWTTEAGYDVLIQGNSNSCGLACCGMVIRSVKGDKMPESAMISESRRIGTGKYREYFSERPGVVAIHGASSVSKVTSVDKTGYLGTYVGNLGQILTNYLVENVTNWCPDPAAVIRGAGNMDLIALVNWDNGGGGHFVVVRNVGNDHMIVRDPYYGVSGQAISGNYLPNNSRAIGATAKFNGWFVQPTGKILAAPRVKVMF